MSWQQKTERRRRKPSQPPITQGEESRNCTLERHLSLEISESIFDRSDSAIWDSFQEELLLWNPSLLWNSCDEDLMPKPSMLSHQELDAVRALTASRRRPWLRCSCFWWWNPRFLIKPHKWQGPNPPLVRVGVALVVSLLRVSLIKEVSPWMDKNQPIHP